MKPKCSTCGSIDHLTKEHPEQVAVKKTLAKLKAQSSKGSTSRNAPLILKPFPDCKYRGFNDHHFDECEYYPGCDICGSIDHETADCTKKLSSNKRKPRIACQRYNEPTGKYSKESGPKVVFGDKSSGDTEGYGSVNCNEITFTRVAYVNVFSTWMAFGGNTHDLGSFGEEMDKITDLHQIHEEVLFTEREDGG
ncbi:hypothetical protein Tco_0173803 [Tanacetum coccineum]